MIMLFCRAVMPAESKPLKVTEKPAKTSSGLGGGRVRDRQLGASFTRSLSVSTSSNRSAASRSASVA